MAAHDAALLDRWIRVRDAEAFRALVDRYSGMVFGTALRIVRSPDRAEDVSQECFLKLAEAPEPQKQSLAAWLHRVSTNLARSFLRSDARRELAESMRPVNHDSPLEATWRELEPLIDEAIESLPPEQRIPIVEHFLHGRTHREIAREIGLTRKAIGYRLGAGIESIRSFLRSRGISATAGVLLAGFAGLAAEAAPESLTASLGKIAVGGAPLVPASAASAPIALASFKKAIAAVVLIGAIIGGGLYLIMRTPGKDGGAAPDRPEAPLLAAKPDAAEAGDAAVAGQAPPAGDEKPAPSPAVAGKPSDSRIAGIVVDEQNRTVAGAEVFFACHPAGGADEIRAEERYLDPDWWQNASAASMVTADGRFAFVRPDGADAASLIAFREGSYGELKRLKLGQDAAEGEIVLKLTPGAVLRGVVYGPGDVPVSDGVVSVYHSYNDEGYAGGPAFATTREDGRFRIGVHSRATRFTVRVNSDTFGQQFFGEVPLGPDEVELRFREMATVRGTIAWVDGPAAAGLLVCMQAEVTEPKPLQKYSGWRFQMMLSAPTDGEGSYEIAGVHPDFLWHIFVADPAEEPGPARLHPLSPRWENRFTLKPGETKVWDYAVSRRIRITGRLVTERTRTPIPRMQVGIYKDGKLIPTERGESDASGAYELILNAGPGKYLIVPTPEATFEGIAAVLKERFGKELDLRGGEDLAVDLEMFEPIELPIRVLEPDGKPAKTIEADVSFQVPNGKRYGMGSSYELDADGRHVFRIYHPIKELSLWVSRFPVGPRTTIDRIDLAAGSPLPEILIALPPTCDLAGTLLGGDRTPHASMEVQIDATGDDGTTDRIHAETDGAGHFAVKDRLRAAPATLRLRLVRTGKEWTSGRLVPAEGQTLDLGEIVIE